MLPSIYENLDDIGISISSQDWHFPFFSYFDFECYFSRENVPKNGPKLVYFAKHVPMSVTISSNFPGKDGAVGFVSEGEENDLVKKMLDYLIELSDWSYEIFCEKFCYSVIFLKP